MEENHCDATAKPAGLSGFAAVPDVEILTSGGVRIPAHAGVLSVASPVLESIIDRPEKPIPITGVPCDAVRAFLHFLYSSRCTEEQLDKHGVHLLALSHVYSVPRLKQIATKFLGEKLATESLVDILQLARLCDAPELYVKCVKLAARHFKAVETTEGWRFLQDHDPWLELEILQFIDESENRKKMARKHREEQRLYVQLSEAMECLEHICTEGCIGVGPHDVESGKKKQPCSKFSTCHGLQLLIKHFATCKKRVNGRCTRCKRMLQLLRLHSSMCTHPDSCKVPLCRQSKIKTQSEKRGDDAMWRLLVKKVVSAKTMSSLSKRKGADGLRMC